ncbi:MAG: hypothetical protein H6525_02805 [Actinobacteria bacterium]|nr:hypothetical protein [Actinomycetota bacterium]MCB9411770.1 hypothetical protein [Actinomycetota bacterium]
MDPEPGPVATLWCPGCRAEMPEDTDPTMTCGLCGCVFDTHLAQEASRLWREERELNRTLEHLDAAMAELEGRRRNVVGSIASWQARREELRAASVLSAVSTAPPAVRTEVPPKVRTQVAAARAHPPLALLLQGTGALLVLAALVVVSAVLWGSLSGQLQVALLVAAVVAVGVLAAVTKRVVPTTSMVLAALTVAALVVVLLAAPQLVRDWASPWYPGIAGVVFTGVALSAGKVARVRLWWFVGVASIPAATVLALASVLEAAAPVAPSWNLALVVALLAAVVVAMAWWAVAAAEADPPTSRTAWWTASVTVFAGWLVSFGAAMPLAVSWAFPSGGGEDGDSWLGALLTALPLALPVLCVGAATVALARPGNLTGYWRGSALRVVGAVVLGTGVGGVLLFRAATAAEAIVAAVAASAVVALGLWAAVRVPRWRGSLLAGVGSVAGFIWVVDATATLVWRADGASAWGAGARNPAAWAWLAALIFGLALAVQLLVLGLRQRWTAPVVLAIVVAAASWWLGYGVGLAPEYVIEASWLPPAVQLEFAWWPAVGFALAVVTLAHRKSMLRWIEWPMLLLVATVPSWIAGVAGLIVGGEAADAVNLRVVLVLVVLGCVAVILPRGRIGFSATALALALAIPWLAVMFEVAPEADRAPAVVTAPTALGVIAVTAWILEPRSSWTSWWVVMRWPLLAVAAVTVGWALAFPLPGGQPVAIVRVILVTAGASALVVCRWRSAPVVAMVAGWVAVAVVWVSVMAGLPAGGQWDVELHTLPSAAALAAAIGLAVHAGKSHSPDRRVSSLLTVAPPLLVALVPTATMAVLDLADDDSLVRFWLVLTVSAALVVLGTVRQLAGVLVPALLSLLIAVAPVALELVEALPVWVPLATIGVLLLLIGARFEHVRRRGKQVAGWIAHLH